VLFHNLWKHIYDAEDHMKIFLWVIADSNCRLRTFDLSSYLIVLLCEFPWRDSININIFLNFYLAQCRWTNRSWRWTVNKPRWTYAHWVCSWRYWMIALTKLEQQQVPDIGNNYITEFIIMSQLWTNENKLKSLLFCSLLWIKHENKLRANSSTVEFLQFSFKRGLDSEDRSFQVIFLVSYHSF
jgi:hypothetical protein